MPGGKRRSRRCCASACTRWSAGGIDRAAGRDRRRRRRACSSAARAPATAPVAGLTPLAAHVHATDPAVSRRAGRLAGGCLRRRGHSRRRSARSAAGRARCWSIAKGTSSRGTRSASMRRTRSTPDCSRGRPRSRVSRSAAGGWSRRGAAPRRRCRTPRRAPPSAPRRWRQRARADHAHGRRRATTRRSKQLKLTQARGALPREQHAGARRDRRDRPRGRSARARRSPTCQAAIARGDGSDRRGQRAARGRARRRCAAAETALVGAAQRGAAGRARGAGRACSASANAPRRSPRSTTR